MSHSLESGFSFGGPLDRILPDPIKDTQPYSTIAPPPIGSDRYWMMETLRESLLGVGISNPNPAVGCILIDSRGNEIARGHTQAYPGFHAERVAFNQIKDPSSLEGATAYVTLEPCSHQGNQPPCVDLLISSNIHRIVIAHPDPNPQVCGQGIEKLRKAGKQVEIGLLAAEASAWNFSFLAYQHLQRPIFALKWAQTLDGQLADDTHRSQWISGPCARAYTHWLRQRYDTILVGANTVILDLPRLSVRDCALPHQHDPLPLIFDPKGIILKSGLETQKNLKAGLFMQKRPLVYITTTPTLNTFRRSKSESWIENRENTCLLQLPGKNLIEELVTALKTPEVSGMIGRPLQSVMIEGGSKTLTSFIHSGYADLLHVIVCPLMTGGKKNRIALNQGLQNPSSYELIASSRLGKDMVMEMTSAHLQSKVFSKI